MSEQWPSKEQEIWFQAGVTGEKQRIIKLLEDEFECGLDDEILHYLIELIKGESK